MHIQQIEIDNFKSFAEKTVIPFRQGFTTISGPNGSGKSNIIDSILFCLGLSSSRTMRAEKLTDLINNSSKKREAIVTITFSPLPEDTTAPKEDVEAPVLSDTEELLVSLDQITPDPVEPVQGMILSDPSAVPPSQNKDPLNKDPLKVARRIKDGPNGYSSTYYLNGRVSTLTEIHEHLSQYNISPGCYNVMMQGDVAGIVNMSPMERRKIVDEIAGVAEFDRKIDQAQQELEATGVNIDRNAILLSEIEGRLEQLSSERDHALKYQKLRDEKTESEKLLLSSKYFGLKQSIASANQNMMQAKKERETTQKTLEGLQAEVVQTREALMSLSEQVKRKGEDQQIAIKKQIEGLKGHVARKEDAIRFLEQQRTDGYKNIEKMQGEISRQKGNMEVLDSDILQLEHQLKELQGLYQQEAQGYERLNQQFDKMTESTGELSTKRAETREKLGLAEDALGHMNREILNLEAQSSRLQQEILMAQEAKTEGLGKLHQAKEKESQLKEVLAETEAEKNQLEKELKDTQLQYSQVRVSVQAFQSQFNQLNKEYLQLDAQKKAYDDVHFGRAVETILRSDIKGIHGTIAQLGSIDSEYALALEIALGGRLQNIVVDDDSVAKEAIDLLQKTRSGRATLLPLNKISGNRSLPMAPRGAGVIDFAYQLMDFDPLYQNIFSYALGDTLIVEDMAAARKLLKQYRMVTLDGSLLEKSGAMTGGSAPSSGASASRLGNTKKIDEELGKLLKRLDQVEVDKLREEKKLTTLELKMDQLKGQYAECMAAYNRLSIEWESVQAQLKDFEAKGLFSVAAETSQPLPQEETLRALAKSIADYEAQVNRQEVVVMDLRALLEKVEESLPQEQLDTLRKSISEVKFQRDHYDSQCRNVQAEIKGKQLEKSHQEQGIQHYLERIEQTKSQEGEIEKEKQAAAEEIQLLALQIKDLDAQTLELGGELKKLQAERDVVQNLLIEQEKNKHVQERQVSLLDEQIVSFQARKRELEPLFQAAKQELLKTGIPLDEMNPEKLPSEEEVTRTLQKLTRQMEAMEPVNMLAIKEFEEVQGRIAELSEKVETLVREREALTVKISGYLELKKISFMKAFENVDRHFKSIFEELSDGVGQLLLTNPEEPFEGGLTIQAQPRGKKMQRLEAMSGGEKSLTSLAFVFALQRYMPAPFYALDEVDMNLDGINAEKLANMVKRESKEAQFIVVSLRKPMIENSERTVGVTQKRDGISKVTGVKLRSALDSEDSEETLVEEHLQESPRRKRSLRETA